MVMSVINTDRQESKTGYPVEEIKIGNVSQLDDIYF